MSDTPATQHRSGPVLFELVAYNGAIYGPYWSAGDAATFAQMMWPDQKQDEDRTGLGWDLQVAGLRD